VTTMRRLVSRLVGSERAQEPVHFHQGPQGLPAVCHDTACELPRLEHWP
jgi:hypothetical protein